MIEWNWYLNNQSKAFLIHWNTSSIYFQLHLNDYMKAIVMYLYGGTYMNMDRVILQPLPLHEFIGLYRSKDGDDCTWCLKNTSGLYPSFDFMRFRPGHKIFYEILD